MQLSLIAAIGKNNELGKGNTLLWHMPADMKHFKETTSGHPVIMGRKTFESIGRPLPNRRNIIITRDVSYKAENVEIAYSLEEAMKFAQNEAEAFVIGGAEIYKLAMPFADKIYLTMVDSTAEADAFFPVIEAEWQEKSREDHSADKKNPYNYTFLVYKKLNSSS